MDRKKIISIIIPILLAILTLFVLTRLFGGLFTSSFVVLISAALILYFAFLKLLRSPDKIWFFLMLVGFLAAGLFLLVFSPSITVMIIPILILLLWLVALAILYFGDIKTYFFRPNIEKIALLVGFLVFAPSPIYAVFGIAYLPLFYFILSMIVAMTDANVVHLLKNAYAISALLMYNSFIGFAYYGIICSLESKSISRVLLWIMMGVSIILALSQKVYWEGGEGTPMPDSTAIEIYYSLFTKGK